MNGANLLRERSVLARWRRACDVLVVTALVLLPAVAPHGVSAGPVEPTPEDAAFFESQVRPLLVAHCAECHSRAAAEPEGGLSFDSRGDFLTHDAIAVPGEPESSLLVEVVRYHGALQMPPAGKLPAEAIATIEDWVRRGLPWPDDGQAAAVGVFDLAARKADHWCWQSPRREPVPPVTAVAWCRNDIDRFVLARLEAAGIAPAPEAPRGQLVRRAAEILTGLPADPAEVDRVITDPDPLAYEKYVDRLLASPHFGERFARHWLDVVRYGETRGHEFDFPIPNAWRYRDWVIDAINADLPYDQFIREQIAGDLLDTPRIDAAGANQSVIGTGFWYLGEEIHSPVNIAQDAADRTDNRVDTFGKAFLGLALGCARCHDHKFDALSKEDYYAIAGTLVSSSYRQVPLESVETNREVSRRLDRHDEQARVVLHRAAAVMLAGSDSPAADAVARLAVRLAATLPAGEELLALRNAGQADGEVLIADYSLAAGATPLISDGFAWGLRPQLPGASTLEVAAEGRPPKLSIEPAASAHFDAVWAGLQSNGERDPGALSGADRAGRVLRTPKVRIFQGTVWHRVRGNMQIFTCVDSHVLLVGPLYNGTLQTIDTQGEWKWVRQDLGSDLAWDQGHLVHVEYVPIAGAADVAQTVAAVAEPKRSDPFLRELLRRLPGDTIDAADLDGVLRDLVAESIAAARAGNLSSGPAAAVSAGVLQRLLADPAINWSGDPAATLVARAEELALGRSAITATAKLNSAIAPAILDGNGIDQPVLQKGLASRPGTPTPRRFLEAVDGVAQPAWPATSSGRRELADRVLDPSNPLASRVAVNRFWHHLFGRGLIPTPDNFGKLGEPASDPGAQYLLDTLAVRFREEGWDVKRLVREIVTSSTWRMQSAADPQAVERDPNNLLLHHYPLRRLEGEAVRDKILAVSGRLERRVGGAPVEVSLSDYHEGRGKPSSGPIDGDGRRSIYTKIRRNFLPALPLAFDMPVPFQARGRRNVTNVPAQALTLMNDPFVLEQSTRWAGRILADEAQSSGERIRRMYLESFSREPAADEAVAAEEFLATQAARHGGDFTADPRYAAAWADLAHALFTSKEFIFVP